jgi:hypothetical protein
MLLLPSVAETRASDQALRIQPALPTPNHRPEDETSSASFQALMFVVVFVIVIFVSCRTTAIDRLSGKNEKVQL